MADTNKNAHAFDECSILHLCELKIPNGFTMFFDKDRLVHKHYSKLKTFVNRLDSKSIPKYRFEPLNISYNIVKAANDLLAAQGEIRMLGMTFKAEIIDQLEEFSEDVMKKFEVILKNEIIDSIKKIFTDNEKKLIKDKNIPGDDDLKIIAGYHDFDSGGKKYLISEDEHFWGYDDLIFNNFNIRVVKEWECHKVSI